MTMRIFIPRDAGAVGVGADEVALAVAQAAAARGTPIEIARTRWRGRHWLEPTFVLSRCAQHELRAGNTW